VWLDYFNALPTWEWYWEATNALTVGASLHHRLINALRVGAAGLQAGELSVAVQVALDLRDSGLVELSRLETMVRSPELSAHEQLISGFYGSYLGPDAEAALARFARFAAALAPRVT